MKKFIILILVLFSIFCFSDNNTVFAQDKVKFIYIHGTNDNNYKKKREFTADVKRLHPYIVKEFNKSEMVNKYLLEGGKYTISEHPLAFYWGAESKNDLNLLADWLDITKFFSPKLAQTVRSMMAHTLHDAIWVQKYNNMKPIIDKLHNITLQIQNDGDKYILLGHSAGSFITYEYFLYKVPYINTESLFYQKKVRPELMKEIKKYGFKTTCIDALIDTDIITYKRDNTFDIKQDNLLQKYKTLSTVEKNSCSSVDYLAGVINFGSPITLFYSGFGENGDVSTKSLVTSILNNNIFYLNMNFAEDPLGFPIATESDYSEILALGENYNNPHINSDNAKNEASCTKYGFVYDKSDLRSNKCVLNAHTFYWKKGKFFSKELVKAYEAGINTFVFKSDI